jgi:hypothetical protein
LKTWLFQSMRYSEVECSDLYIRKT